MLAAFGGRTLWASLTISTATLGRQILLRTANISKPPASHAVQEQPADRKAAALCRIDTAETRQALIAMVKFRFARRRRCQSWDYEFVMFLDLL
jgi:hypothetical protein